jgi:hypothetical protein
MAWVSIESVRSGATSAAVLAYGMGSVALGAIAAFAMHRLGRVPFFSAVRDAPGRVTSMSREHTS